MTMLAGLAVSFGLHMGQLTPRVQLARIEMLAVSDALASSSETARIVAVPAEFGEV